MTAMTRPIAPGTAQYKHRTLSRAALILFFWSSAALLVAFVHQMLAAWPVAGVTIEIIAIVAVSAVYIRFVTPEATLDHALFVGTTWTLLGIATEIFMTAGSGRQWFALLGTPANGGLRCALLIAWVIAPALFVRSSD